ncbi:MAG: 3-oxoacyl-[acyl-carrier-protein] reductase [Fimbriimonadaceae bacterium]
MKGLAGKVAIVTGASRGIGREIAMRLAAEGAMVACVATTEAGAMKTAADIEASEGSAKPFACDVSDFAQVEALFESIGSELGVPEILVNNAGITRDTLIMRMGEEDWDRVLDVNLKGSFLCIKAATRGMMKARYGRIVNVSSVIGLGGGAGQANYAASKAGLIGLTKSVAKELGSRNITCNAIAPGFIESDMTSELSAEFREFVQKHAPAGRLGNAGDIAPVVAFLCSAEAAYITGQVIVIDGGLTL